jgi:hypothetical protein
MGCMMSKPLGSGGFLVCQRPYWHEGKHRGMVNTGRARSWAQARGIE